MKAKGAGRPRQPTGLRVLFRYGENKAIVFISDTNRDPDKYIVTAWDVDEDVKADEVESDAAFAIVRNFKGGHEYVIYVQSVIDGVRSKKVFWPDPFRLPRNNNFDSEAFASYSAEVEWPPLVATHLKGSSTISSYSTVSSDSAYGSQASSSKKSGKKRHAVEGEDAKSDSKKSKDESGLQGTHLQRVIKMILQKTMTKERMDNLLQKCEEIGVSDTSDLAIVAEKWDQYSKVFGNTLKLVEAERLMKHVKAIDSFAHSQLSRDSTSLVGTQKSTTGNIAASGDFGTGRITEERTF